jgi:quercetin dioxygenase-like cupin family protein
LRPVRNLVRIAHSVPVAGLLAAAEAPSAPALQLRTMADGHAVELPAFHAMHRHLWPLLDMIYVNVGGRELGAVTVQVIEPGGRIAPSAQPGERFEQFALVLTAAPGAFLHVEAPGPATESTRLTAGELWWFDRQAPHWICNASDAPMVLLVVDAVAPRYRLQHEQELAAA